MGNQDYQNEKVRISYELMKNRKLFRKARAIIMKDNKLLAIKVVYKDDRPDHYLFPGGGVDEGETISEAAVREAYEEYGVRVTPIKQLGKQYYSVQMKYNGESFYSKRVEYHYICELDNIDENSDFGIDGEFSREDRTYEKVELSLDDIRKLNYNDLNDINKNNYNRLIKFMTDNNKKRKNYIF